ncbi:MAG: hypothetical protein V3U88_08775 [Methylococcales bacterium]
MRARTDWLTKVDLNNYLIRSLCSSKDFLFNPLIKQSDANKSAQDSIVIFAQTLIA